MKKNEAKQAEALKLQANQAFQDGDYVSAIRLFTDAINLTPTNNVLYSNRSMAFLKAGNCTFALKDADTCVRLDPHFVKGYFRVSLALSAMHRYGAAVQFLRSAQKRFSKDKDLPTEIDLLERQYIENQKRCDKISLFSEEKVAVQRIHNLVKENKLTFDESIDKKSAIYRLLAAMKEFHQGLDILHAFKAQQQSDGQLAIEGEPGSLELLSNAILIDPRGAALPVGDWNGFMKSAQLGVMFELAKFGGFGDTLGISEIMKNVKELITKKGWQAAKLSLEISVRARLMTGLGFCLAGEFAEAIPNFTNAVGLIDMAKKEIPGKSLGVISDDFFSRGIIVLILHCIKMGIKSTKDCVGFPFSDLKNLSENVLKSVENQEKKEKEKAEKEKEEKEKEKKEEKDAKEEAEDGSKDVAFKQAHVAVAHECLGYFYSLEAHDALEKTPTTTASPSSSSSTTSPSRSPSALYKQSAEHFLLSAEFIPEDDVLHPTAIYLGN